MGHLELRAFWVADDGTETFQGIFKGSEIVVTPPEPEDDPIIAIVLASPTLTVRSSPKVAPDNAVGKFQKGEQIWVSVQTYATDGDDWIWRKVVKVNGDGDSRVGKYVAEKKRDGSSPLLDLEEKEPTPDPDDIMPSLYPVVARQYEAKQFLSVQIDGHNSRQQIGVNMRRAMWMTGNGVAVVDSELAKNGVDAKRLLEELDRFNKPNWTDHEPYFGHLLRVFVQNSKYGIAQAKLNALAFLDMINQYRDGNGIPYIRVVFCLVDTYNARPHMVFKGDVADEYHDGPVGKTGSRYWEEGAWRNHLLPLIDQFVPAVTIPGYQELIFGWQIMNEPALTEPATEHAIDAYVKGNQVLAKAIWEACGGRHHIMTGLRTGHDIAQGTITTADFYNRLLGGDGQYITMLNFHPYCKKPPIVSTKPDDLFDEWRFMREDIEAARAHKRPIIADEMGTYLEGYQASDAVQRDTAMQAALEYLQHDQGVWCCMPWNQSLTATYDIGIGDASRGLTRYYQREGQQVDVISTPGVVKVLHDHAQANYQRG